LSQLEENITFHILWTVMAKNGQILKIKKKQF